MDVVECDVPLSSVLSRELIERAYFRDSYRAPLSRGELGIVDIFFGIFAHHPLWMKLLLIARNTVASLAGLGAPTAAEILHVEIKDRYAVGEKIGVWPIFSLSADEVVAGRDNKHMDFRLSVLKVPDGDRPSVVVSTICTVHNLTGKLYFFRRSVPQVRRPEADGERARGAETVMHSGTGPRSQLSSPLFLSCARGLSSSIPPCASW